jgi:cyclic pyranopterin phosphate synthase
VDAHDRRVRYLRLSLTDRCNLRCTYCMPPEGVPHRPRHELASLEEINAIVEAFANLGVERVRLTGGEPTARRGIVDLVRRLAKIRRSDGRPLQVVMTTNGTRLQTLAKPLRKAGLAGLSVSLDTLDPERYERITRRRALEQVLAGIAAARAAGFAALKLNAVAIAGFNDDELGRLCRFAWSHDATPRFIELMPMAGGRLFAPGALLPADQIRARVSRELDTPLVDEAHDPAAPLGPARYVRVARGPHAGRRLGTIAAMTENFCDGCNRIRIDSSGSMRACLARDDHGDLRRALTNGGREGLAERVRALLEGKRARHAFGFAGEHNPATAMVSIGG